MAKNQATIRAVFVRTGKAVAKAKKLKQLRKHLSWANKQKRTANSAAKKILRKAKKAKGKAKKKYQNAAKLERFRKKIAGKLIPRIKKRMRVVKKK